jgi:hypothetical protein
MSTEFVFERVILSSSPEGMFLKIKLPFESREAARNFVDTYNRGQKYVCTLKQQKAKRSLDQNGYFWTLCNQLSAVLKMPPKDIYREYVKDVGGNYEITPIKADNVKHWVEIWEAQGIGFIAEDMGESKIKGYHNIRNYYGSSTYDKAQMGRLLDLIIADCDENGIVTLTPEEIAKLGEEGV